MCFIFWRDLVVSNFLYMKFPRYQIWHETSREVSRNFQSKFPWKLSIFTASGRFRSQLSPRVKDHFWVILGLKTLFAVVLKVFWLCFWTPIAKMLLFFQIHKVITLMLPQHTSLLKFDKASSVPIIFYLFCHFLPRLFFYGVPTRGWALEAPA